MSESPSSDARFRRVYVEHRDAIWAYCRRRVPRDDAMDAVADVFVVVWRRLDDLPDGDGARVWLYGIARNVVRNHWRSARRRDRLGRRLAGSRSFELAGTDTGPDDADDPAELRAAVARLSDDDQELLRLRAWEELSLAEIASVVDLSVRAVEYRLARIRKRLSNLLAGPDPVNHRLSPARRPGGAR